MAAKLAASSWVVGKPALQQQNLSGNTVQDSHRYRPDLLYFRLLKKALKIDRTVRKKTLYGRVGGLMSDITLCIWKEIELGSTNYKSYNTDKRGLLP